MRLAISLLLPFMGHASNVEPDGRRLDATYVPPTPKPTTKPTLRPTAKASSSPTVSPEPTISPAPTIPGAPPCQGEWPFCYDGTGFDGGKSYTTCYVLDESEFCGDYDFMIVGQNSTSGGSYNFDRCPDVWEWFVSCAASSYTSCEKQPGGKFTYNNPYIYARYMGWNKKWEFLMMGGGVDGALSWYCDKEEDAKGMKHFADWIKGNNLFKTPVATCDTPAPSMSHAPTVSPAPTNPRAPSCDTTGYADYRPVARYDYIMHNSCFRTDGGNNCFMVTETCKYRVTGTDVNGVELYDTPAQWLSRAVERFAGVPVDLTGDLTGVPVPPESIVRHQCEGGWCVTFEESAGVSGGELSWSFVDELVSKRFYSLWYGIAANSPIVWETTDVLHCGSGPFCYDDKDYTMCRVDPRSENCGPFDFVIEGQSDYGRSGDVWSWFLECAKGYGCELYQTGRYEYEEPWGRSYWNVWSKRWEFVSSVGGAGGETKWHCPDEETAEGLEHFFFSVRNATLFDLPPFECTDSPTTSPTTCTDSFLTRPPLNIGVVIDTSFSTFETQFDGTEIGDVNNDSAANTILDAEIEAVIGLLSTILEAEELDNSNVDIGIILFDTEATYEGHFAPLNDDNTGLNQALVDRLKGIHTEANGNLVLEKNIGFTNFDDALDKSIDYFKDPFVPADRTNLLVFLSDGKPNVRGDGDNEPWCPSSVDCSGAPENLDDDPSTAAWERGQLSFCYSGDESCFGHDFEECARSDNCLGDEAAKMFDSELEELDALQVHRLSIGVGSKSYTAEDSGLWLIDNNPMKVSHNVLPRQVLTSDDLINALRDLCPENTPRPTSLPSASPTKAPTVSPSQGPTHSPSVSPTAGPTTSPTVDYCDNLAIDFSTGANFEPTADGYAYPREWEEYGLHVSAVSAEQRDKQEPGRAFYYQTGIDGIGKTLIIQEDNIGTESASMNPSGGEFVIKLDTTHDKEMKIDLFDVSGGGSIARVDEEGHAIGAEIELSESPDQLQSVLVPVGGVSQVVIVLYGRGALAQLNLCRNPNRTPSPIGMAVVNETREPTASPNSPPADNTCPADIKLVASVGGTEFDELPLRIVSRDATTVTVEITSAFSHQVAFQYTKYISNNSKECVQYQDVDTTTVDQITADCMVNVPISIFHFYVSDESLQEGADEANIPDCCHGPEDDNNPKVQYTFQVYCVPQCPDDEGESS